QAVRCRRNRGKTKASTRWATAYTAVSATLPRKRFLQFFESSWRSRLRAKAHQHELPAVKCRRAFLVRARSWIRPAGDYHAAVGVGKRRVADAFGPEVPREEAPTGKVTIQLAIGQVAQDRHLGLAGPLEVVVAGRGHRPVPQDGEPIAREVAPPQGRHDSTLAE